MISCNLIYRSAGVIKRNLIFAYECALDRANRAIFCLFHTFANQFICYHKKARHKLCTNENKHEKSEKYDTK